MSTTHYPNLWIQIFSYSWVVNKYLKNNFTDVLSTQESDKIQMTFSFLEQWSFHFWNKCIFFCSDSKAWSANDDSIVQGRLQYAAETSVSFQLWDTYTTRADLYGTSPVSKLEKFTGRKPISPEMPSTWFSLKQGSNSRKQLKIFVEGCAVLFIEM